MATLHPPPLRRSVDYLDGPDHPTARLEGHVRACVIRVDRGRLSFSDAAFSIMWAERCEAEEAGRLVSEALDPDAATNRLMAAIVAYEAAGKPEGWAAQALHQPAPLSEPAAEPAPPEPEEAPLQPHYPAPANTRSEALAAQARTVPDFLAKAARNVAIRDAWRKRMAALELDCPPKSPGRRAALRAARAEMVAYYGLDWRRPGDRLLLPAAAGSGKTSLTATKVAAVMGRLGRLNFYTDTIDNAVAVADKIRNAAVIRGRSQPDPKNPGKRMCLRHEAAEAVAQAGLQVSSTLCRDAEGRTCHLAGQCGFQREAAARRANGVTVHVGSHEYLPLGGDMGTPDAVIIDENCIGTLIGHAEFGLDRLLPLGLNWEAAGDANAADAFGKAMYRVIDAMTAGGHLLAALRERGFRAKRDFDEMLRFLRAVEEAAFTGDISTTMADAEIRERLDRHRGSEIALVVKMLVALQAEIELPRDLAHGVVFEPDKQVWIGEGDDARQERQARISVHYRKRLARIADDIPVFLLDASGDLSIYRRFFGERLVEVEAVRCERNVHVTQIVDVVLGRSSLTGTDRRGKALSATSQARADKLRGEMVETVNALARKHGSILLDTYEAVEKLITSEQAEIGVVDAVLTGHFGKMRGTDAYKHCPAAMILGRNEPPATAMENDARAVHSDDPIPLDLPGEYEPVTRGIRMRDGSAVPVKVKVHRDPRVQALLELRRERESEQGADRLRLIHNEVPKTLILASNVPLDITVDRVVTRQQFIHETLGRLDNGQRGKGRRVYGNRLAEAFRLAGGVLPQSRRELWRLTPIHFRGLWDSERAIRNDLDAFDNWAVSANRTPIADTAQLIRARVMAYRVEGQRGEDRHALISPSVVDGRTALEVLLGQKVVAYGPAKPADLAQDAAPAEAATLAPTPPVEPVQPQQEPPPVPAELPLPSLAQRARLARLALRLEDAMEARCDAEAVQREPVPPWVPGPVLMGTYRLLSLSEQLVQRARPS